ncbi:MAG: hypothetical protein QXG00_04065 [Candidatus Woesearchaeota archaeon]
MKEKMIDVLDNFLYNNYSIVIIQLNEQDKLFILSDTIEYPFNDVKHMTVEGYDITKYVLYENSFVNLVIKDEFELEKFIAKNKLVRRTFEFENLKWLVIK